MNELAKRSAHIRYDLNLRPYHKVISNLVDKYGVDGCNILDVGCGTGNMLELLSNKNKNYQLFGADIDPRCLEVTNERVNLVSGLKIDDVLDLFEPSYGLENKFDIIVMSHVLEHVTRPFDTVNGLMTLLKPGGHLILAVPNPVRPDVILKSIFRKYSVNKGHVQTWDMSHWKNFLEVILGLNVIEYPTDFIKAPKIDNLKFLHPILILIAKLFPGFARSCMAVIKKDN